MIILDENVPESQAQLLRTWRIRGLLIGRDILRSRNFNARGKRLGAVIRASSAGLQVWRRHEAREIFLPWSD